MQKIWNDRKTPDLCDMNNKYEIRHTTFRSEMSSGKVHLQKDEKGVATYEWADPSPSKTSMTRTKFHKMTWYAKNIEQNITRCQKIPTEWIGQTMSKNSG